ncbi:hypothetical protein AK812_SmicGene31147 [Symbiodinium microadriaticum]|uniref:Uncharacterized protein n=1 Tax=Symbiodinium microadriaticum TaxID=2951 RepID=A0A1Q9CXF9_SYMMI|nr:hypothetical protein AK812_SmicGene31147 [Symbiodinium microadriaticum]
MDARSTAAVSALLHFHLWIATRLRPETGNSPRPLANVPPTVDAKMASKLTGKISLEDVDAQWGRPGAEASSKFQCPHCRTESTLKLRVETVATSVLKNLSRWAPLGTAEIALI